MIVLYVWKLVTAVIVFSQDKFESVAKQSLENKRMFEELTDIFQERAAAEDSYSKTMEKLTI